jgi:tetratricopeptide (TPR) repeat protein
MLSKVALILVKQRPILNLKIGSHRSLSYKLNVGAALSVSDMDTHQDASSISPIDMNRMFSNLRYFAKLINTGNYREAQEVLDKHREDVA